MVEISIAVQIWGSSIQIAELFKGFFFLYYYNFYRRPRIKHENLWPRFELSESFWILDVVSDLLAGGFTGSLAVWS